MGDEVPWRQEPALGMSPANEGLCADDLATGEVDLRLVVENKFAAVQSAPEIGAARPAGKSLAAGRIHGPMLAIGRIAQLAQLELSRHHVRHVLQDAQLTGREAGSMLDGEDGEGSDDLALGGADRCTCEEGSVEDASFQRRAVGALARGIRHDDRAVLFEHEIEDRVGAWKLAHMLTPPRLDPHTALIAEAKAGGIGVEVLGRELGDGAVAGLEACRGSRRKLVRRGASPPHGDLHFHIQLPRSAFLLSSDALVPSHTALALSVGTERV